MKKWFERTAMAVMLSLCACSSSSNGLPVLDGDGGEDVDFAETAMSTTSEVGARPVLGTGGCEDPDRPGQQLSRECSTACGRGTQRCTMNRWTECTAASACRAVHAVACRDPRWVSVAQECRCVAVTGAGERASVRRPRRRRSATTSTTTAMGASTKTSPARAAAPAEPAPRPAPPAHGPGAALRVLRPRYATCGTTIATGALMKGSRRRTRLSTVAYARVCLFRWAATLATPPARAGGSTRVSRGRRS
jgi:hypothetical protein